MALRRRIRRPVCLQDVVIAAVAAFAVTARTTVAAAGTDKLFNNTAAVQGAVQH